MTERRIARLDSRALVRVGGTDVRPFLHNLLTQDVETLSPGEVRYGALLSPPGRLMFDLFLWGEADGVVLEVARERRDDLMRRLAMYRLRAAVEIAGDERAVFACWGAASDGFVADPRLPDLGGRRLGGADAVTASEAEWRAHEVAAGVGGLQDWPDDGAYPIELNFDLLNGIDFQKGCFVGQETTSRMKRRGTIKTRLLPLSFEGPAPALGAEVLNGDLRAGQVRGAAGDGLAMGLMRLDRLDGPLSVDGRAVTVGRRID